MIDRTKPKVGETVQFLPELYSGLSRGLDHERVPQVLAAMVIGVNEDGRLDLCVYARNGNQVMRFNVPYVWDTADSNVNVVHGHARPIQ